MRGRSDKTMSPAKTQRRQDSEKIGIYFTLRLCALAGENLQLLLSNKLHDRN